MTYKIDVNIADDHTMLVEGLVQAINSSQVAHVSHSYNTLEACRQNLEHWVPDVMLLDISMPDGSGIEFCKYLMSAYPALRIIAITCHDEYSIIQRMIELGVHGYVLKSAPVQQLLEAISTVYHGQRYISPEVAGIIERGKAQQIYLTPIEHKVLTLICQGLTNPEIADVVHLSVDSVNWYRKRLLSKFNVKNSVSLVALALREQLVDNDI